MKFTMVSIFVVLTSISAMAEAEQALSQNKAIAIAQAPQDQATAKIDLAIGVCQLVNSLGVNGRDDPISPIYALSPAQDVSAYFSMAGNTKWLDYTKNVTVTLQQGTEHGTIKEERNTHFRYLPLEAPRGKTRRTAPKEFPGRYLRILVYPLRPAVQTVQDERWLLTTARSFEVPQPFPPRLLSRLILARLQKYLNPGRARQFPEKLAVGSKFVHIGQPSIQPQMPLKMAGYLMRSSPMRNRLSQ